MTSKDIFDAVRRHHVFVDQVVHGVSDILTDFTESKHGRRYKATVLPEGLQFDEAAGCLTLESKHRLEEGVRHEIAVQVLGHGQVEVHSSWYASSSDNESSIYSFGFDPASSGVEHVAARILSAIAASPDSEIAVDFDKFILPKIGRTPIATQSLFESLPDNELG